MFLPLLFHLHSLGRQEIDSGFSHNLRLCLCTFGFAHNPKSISFKLWSSSISKFSCRAKSWKWVGRHSTTHIWPQILLGVTFNQRLPVWGPCAHIPGCARRPSLKRSAWKTPWSPLLIGGPLLWCSQTAPHLYSTKKSRIVWFYSCYA